MANFHTNQFAIAANADDMVKVLCAMSANLAAHEETKWVHDPDLGPTPEEAFGKISETIEYCYGNIFAPDDMGQPISEVSSSGVGVQSAPAGRPLSDTANVALHRVGDTYVLIAMYSTARYSNQESFDLFVEQLPGGRYGTAFIDADEYDNYDETAFEFAMIVNGVVDDQFSNDDNYMSFDEFWDYAEPYWRVDYAHSDDLGAIAFMLGARDWVGSVRSGEGFSFPEMATDDHQVWGVTQEASVDDDAFFQPDWKAPGERERDLVKSAVYSMLCDLPCAWEISGGSYRGRADRLERLVPCSEVILKSNWESPYFTPAAIEVLNANGGSLGNLEIGGDVALAAVACLVPYLRAYAYEVEPLSILSARTRHPRMTVLVEIASPDLDEVLTQVDELLSLPACERSRKSVIEEGGR